ncbi:hypothetical protein CPLU01_07903 [Colletotrichum plurivorum]|uniref:Uncharacterized protein n=1 Tax=Colletotrichum plurivorum TaxID=2175906 RepID=A0A8H6KD89_9PEZI|nr:hypothetical protein CPLU01_07903 [Colletotrichum plurivorum]
MTASSSLARVKGREASPVPGRVPRVAQLRQRLTLQRTAGRQEGRPTLTVVGRVRRRLGSFWHPFGSGGHNTGGWGSLDGWMEGISAACKLMREPVFLGQAARVRMTGVIQKMEGS